MTATDELRRMLDERGVEWWSEDDQEKPAYYFVTKWFANGCEQTYEEIPAIRSRSLKAYCITPEQAIAATLGPREQPPYDELIEALRRDWDIEASWDGLRRFWYVGLTDEGVRKRDEREAALGRGACQLKQASWDDGTCTWGCICTACDAHLEHETGYGYNFCPICGAKVVTE